MAYALDKRMHQTRESTSEEVARIHARWTRANVHACRYCGQPMIVHNQAYCERMQSQVEQEENCE